MFLLTFKIWRTSGSNFCLSLPSVVFVCAGRKKERGCVACCPSASLPRHHRKWTVDGRVSSTCSCTPTVSPPVRSYFMLNWDKFIFYQCLSCWFLFNPFQWSSESRLSGLFTQFGIETDEDLSAWTEAEWNPARSRGVFQTHGLVTSRLHSSGFIAEENHFVFLLSNVMIFEPSLTSSFISFLFHF